MKRADERIAPFYVPDSQVFSTIHKMLGLFPKCNHWHLREFDRPAPPDFLKYFEAESWHQTHAGEHDF